MPPFDMISDHATSQSSADVFPAGRMECGVCWHVYDPAIGDEVWQIEPGVAFHDLPGHWRCPVCDGAKSQFLPLDESCNHNDMDSSQDDIERIVEAYRRVDRDRMQDMPFRNGALRVEAVGFRDWGSERLGVIISPWFINLVLVPGANTNWSAHRHGDKVVYTLPSGSYEFVHGDLEEFGPIQTCSLMSPVGDLQDQDTARLVAEEVMRLMVIEAEPQDPTGMPLLSAVTDEETAPKVEVKTDISRRELLRGRLGKSSEED